MQWRAFYDNDYESHGQFGGADVDLQIIQDQLDKYYAYIEKARKNPAYELARSTLDQLQEGVKEHMNVGALVTEMTEIFNLLDEHGFPMGRAVYPGPGAEWKKLVFQYLGE